VPEEKDSLLDRAESLARRVLERVGAKVDDRKSSSYQQTLSPREVGDVTSKIERAVDANLRDDAKGVKRVAPNLFQVLFPYEVASRLNASYVATLAEELTTTVYEYINNRRYETTGQVRVTSGQDLFAKSPVVKAFFEGEGPPTGPGREERGEAAEAGARSEITTRAVAFTSDDGRAFHIVLKQGEGPVYIGRAAGVALRIDDPSISRLHCSLTLRQNGEVVMADLGSSNGTTVNEASLDTQKGRALARGDRVVVGNVNLKVSEII
jgi:hypothetical protein